MKGSGGVQGICQLKQEEQLTAKIPNQHTKYVTLKATANGEKSLSDPKHQKKIN